MPDGALARIGDGLHDQAAKDGKPWDCSVQESVRTVERLAALSVDGLFPGHLTFAVNEGRRHTEKAMDYVRRLLPPPQLT